MKKAIMLVCAMLAAACGGDGGTDPEPECVHELDPALTYEVRHEPAEGVCLNGPGSYLESGAKLRAFTLDSVACAFDLQVTTGRGWLEIDHRGIARGRLKEPSLYRECYYDVTITPVQ